MLILKKKTFKGLLMALLVLLSWGASAQVAVNSVAAQTPVSFASTDFKMDSQLMWQELLLLPMWK